MFNNFQKVTIFIHIDFGKWLCYWLPLMRVSESAVAVVNDSPVDSQSHDQARHSELDFAEQKTEGEKYKRLPLSLIA